MINLINMLGNGLIKKEKKTFSSSSATKNIAPKKVKEKLSLEIFLKDILGTHLIDKKSKI